MPVANPLLGCVLHAFGAYAAANCYTPQSMLKGWSWQTYWLAQASVCWFFAPIIGAWLTIPHLDLVLREAPRSAMLLTFVLGVAYGVGGTAFGVSIRYIGYSLTYAIAIGLSCILGTLTGPILQHTLKPILDKPGAHWIMAGVFIGVLGTFICGIAGRMKEVELMKSKGEASTFALGKGLFLCVVAGVLAAVYGLAVNDAGAAIAKAAENHGAGNWQTNVVYIFSNTGAFVTTAAYCIWLGIKNRTFGEFKQATVKQSNALPINYIAALLTGLMWYTQFLFYGQAHVRMGTFQFSSWAIHMLMLILFSSLTGVLMKEWHGRRTATKAVITIALIVLTGAILMLTYGNWVGAK